MNKVNYLVLAAIIGICLAWAGPRTEAQASVTVGPAPVCPYGYFDYPPYACAPYGYYGSEWFLGGVFIGAGPWYHGPGHFYGHVDNHFDPQHRYRGAFPNRGDRPNPENHVERIPNFHGNEIRDGRGHTGGVKR